MGLRPINGFYFGDMGTYANLFASYQDGEIGSFQKDIVFNYFILWSSKVMSVEIFFLLCAALYVFPLYLTCKTWFDKYWFYAFIFLVGSFSFWAYGTNGIRNGIATSIFLLGISRKMKFTQLLIVLISIGFHKSLLLPAIGFFLAQNVLKPNLIVVLWLLCIPLSLISGGFWENFFAGLGFDDDRLSYLTAGNVNADEFSSIGFRWDFLLYSASAVFCGWYFIMKKGYNDVVYLTLFSTYVFSNSFWILVIRANFSNRFAYLSWFMMALVIVYPFVRGSLKYVNNKILGGVLMAYFAFTFFMNIFIY